MPRTRRLLLPALAVAALAVPATAGASYSAHVNAPTSVQLTGTDAKEGLAIGVDDQGRLTHNQTAPGFASALDFDTTAAGTQSVTGSTSAPVHLTVDAEGGNDVISLGTATAVLSADGGDGDDVIQGGGGRDLLQGGAGVDILDGRAGADRIFGGGGDDRIPWDVAGSSDRTDGGDGTDTLVAFGTQASEQFTVSSVAPDVVDVTISDGGHMRLTAGEIVHLSMFGGDDSLEPELVPAGIRLEADGNAGDDFLVGGAGPDLLEGGPGDDDVRGGGGDDELEGESATGGAGNDLMLLSPSPDGTQIAEGEEGYDVTRVQGSAGADVLTLSSSAPYVRIDGTMDVQRFIAGVESEALVLQTGDGDDIVATRPGTGAQAALTIEGGAGDDVLRGSDGIETLTGAAGVDIIDSGLAPDRMDGGDGDDLLRARDGAADLVACGAGADMLLADLSGVDGLLDASACEQVANGPFGGATPLARVIAPAGLKLGSGVVKTSVACSAGARGGCAGTLSLVAGDGLTVGDAKAPALLGKQAFSLAPGTTGEVAVPVRDADDLVRSLGGARAFAVKAQALTPLAEHTTAVPLEILR